MSSDIYNAFLKENNFSSKLEQWSKAYKGKKIVLYGCGLLFDEIVNSYDINSKLNIIGVCDVRYEADKPENYRGFVTLKPSELPNTDFDVIIFTVFDHLTCLNYLNTFGFFDENKTYHWLRELSLKTKIDTSVTKFCTAFKYFLGSGNLFKAIKYYLFCDLSELNSKYNYLKNLKRLRAKARQSKKIKVIFIVESNQKWGWQSVYDELKKDSRFELLLVTLPITTRYKGRIYPQKEDIEFFSKLNMPIIDGYDYKKEVCIDLRALGADIVFYTHPWFVDVNKIPPSKVSEFALTCAISYGFNVAESNVWGTTTPKIFCGNLWTMFAESVFHKSFYENGTGLKNKDILYITGYPKMDAYKNPVAEGFEAIWKDEKHLKPHIIYAPHHSIEREGGFCASNFVEHAKFFLDFAKNHPEYEFIIKPHPVLKSKCEAIGFMSADEYEAYIDEWRNLPNGNAYTQGNYYDLFKTSDLLITDCFSFLGEYFVSKKPIILLESKSRIAYNEFGNILREGMYRPKSVADIENILKEIFIEKKDVLQSKRMQIIKQEFFLPSGGSGKYIADYLRKTLF